MTDQKWPEDYETLLCLCPDDDMVHLEQYSANGSNLVSMSPARARAVARAILELVGAG